MNIDIKEFLKLDFDNINIIDIRNTFDYRRGHISGSINIPSNYLIYNFSKYLDKNRTYYIYCNSGISSLNLVNKLNSFGYNTITIDGGYNKYLLEK